METVSKKRQKSSAQELLVAAKKGDAQRVLLLLSRGADTEYTDNDGDTVLNNASWKGKLEVVRLLVEHGASLEHKNKKDLNALHHASCKGRVKCARYLIEKGINVNSVTKKGTTPLIMAARNNQLEVVKLLLKLGANKELKDENGSTALKAAQEKKFGQLADFLLNHRDKRALGEELLVHAKFGNLDEVKKLLAQGAPIEHQDDDLDSILNNAAWMGHVHIISHLVEKGARLESPNRNNLTALHHACYKGHRAAALWLLSKGANMNRQTKKGNTPLIMAAKNGLKDTCRLLIEAGADVSTRNEDGHNAADCARARGKDQASQFLDQVLRNPENYGPKKKLKKPPDTGDGDDQKNREFAPNPTLMHLRSNNAHKAQESVRSKIAAAKKGCEELFKRHREQIENLRKNARTVSRHAFLSHAQADSQDVVQTLSHELQDSGLKCWFDMEQPDLDVENMINGIAESATFIVFASQKYFQRQYCLFELKVAHRLEKPCQVLWEPDVRKGGFLSFADFAKAIPDTYASYLGDSEALKWERQNPYKAATLALLKPRLERKMPLQSWTSKQCGEWVANLGKAFEDYEQVFEDNCLDGKSVVRLTLGDLTTLGVKKIHARVILRKVSSWTGSLT